MAVSRSLNRHSIVVQMLGWTSEPLNIVYMSSPWKCGSVKIGRKSGEGPRKMFMLSQVQNVQKNLYQFAPLPPPHTHPPKSLVTAREQSKSTRASPRCRGLDLRVTCKFQGILRSNERSKLQKMRCRKLYVPERILGRTKCLTCGQTLALSSGSSN